MSLTPQALRLLSRELVTLRSDPPEDVRVVVDEEDISQLTGWVAGPAGTPYEGGYFKVHFSFGSDYPGMPPKCTMKTKIFHPNVSKSGEICVDTLKKGWKKEYGVGHVLVTIKCLLIYPNPESALDEEAGKQLLADYEGYCKVPPPEFRAVKSSTSSPTKPHASSSISGPASVPRPTALALSATTSSKADPALPSSSSSLTGTTSKPAPLGQTIQQEQSPIVDQDGLVGGGDVVKEKMASVAGSAAGSSVAPTGIPVKKTVVKKAPVPAAKRGLKRL